MFYLILNLFLFHFLVIFLSSQSVFWSTLTHQTLEDENVLIEVLVMIHFQLRLTVLTFVHLKALIYIQYKLSFYILYYILLYRHECFTGKYTTRKIHKRYIRDPSGLFSIISLVSVSMT